MDQRQSLLNLAITVAIVGSVAVAAQLLRNRHPHSVPIRREPLTGAAEVAPALPGGPAQRPVEKYFQSFPNVQLVESPANEGDTLRLRLPKEGEHVFVQYFIDALDTSFTHLDRVNEQAHYFGKASNEAVVEAGREAMAYVTDLLKNHPFMVLTRWERVPATDRYYALIRVEYEKGRWRYLSELLVRQGYARISGVTTPLPDTKMSEDDYLQELNTAAKLARQKKLGIWAKLKK
jgi:endonuclease YncB( thermonuclease family)